MQFRDSACSEALRDVFWARTMTNLLWVFAPSGNKITTVNISNTASAPLPQPVLESSSTSHERTSAKHPLQPPPPPTRSTKRVTFVGPDRVKLIHVPEPNNITVADFVPQLVRHLQTFCAKAQLTVDGETLAARARKLTVALQEAEGALITGHMEQLKSALSCQRTPVANFRTLEASDCRTMVSRFLSDGDTRQLLVIAQSPCARSAVLT